MAALDRFHCNTHRSTKMWWIQWWVQVSLIMSDSHILVCHFTIHAIKIGFQKHYILCGKCNVPINSWTVYFIINISVSLSSQICNDVFLIK